jgi:hypothetical protein
MSTQHTPGEWDICWDGKRYVIHDSTALQRHIAYTSDGGVPDGEARANALLFRAAPDLLKALKQHDAYMLDAGYSGPESDALHPKAAENWRRVRAAIAKATTP